MNYTLNQLRQSERKTHLLPLFFHTHRLWCNWTHWTLRRANTSCKFSLYVFVLTVNGEFVSGAGDGEFHATSALGVVATAQTWHTLFAPLVNVHVACCSRRKDGISRDSHNGVLKGAKIYSIFLEQILLVTSFSYVLNIILIGLLELYSYFWLPFLHN